MKKGRDFNNILDECLERVIKGESIEHCLSEYPDDAAELEPLLQTALTAKEASTIKPRPDFRERASHQFQAAIREMESRKSRGLLGWQPQWVTAVIVVVVLLLAGSGTVAAANNSMPDEPLYQVKLATEAVRLTLTPSALNKAELYVKLADKRVAEIIEMADKGKLEQVEQTAQRLNTQLVAVASLTAPEGEEISKENLAASSVEQPMLAAEEAPLASIEEAPRLTVREVPQVEAGEAPPTAVEKVPRAQLRTVPSTEPEEAPLTAVEETPVITAPQAPGQPEDAGSGKNGNDENLKPDKQAKLKQVLSRKSIENQNALQALLERVPESVKPTLQRAIEIAGARYEQALRNLD